MSNFKFAIKLLFLLFFSLISVFGAEKENEEDILSKIHITDKILKEKTLELQIIDNFTTESSWKFFRNVSFLNLSEIQPFAPESRPFRTETGMLKNHAQLSGEQYSLALQSFVENKKRQSFEFRPARNIEIQNGYPVRLIFWIYSNNYDLSLSAVFSQKNSYDYTVKVDHLNHTGWKRVEAIIQLPDTMARKIRSRQIPVYLTAFRLKPGPFMEKGPFHIYIDRMYMLVNRSVMKYPGADIQDNWGKE